MAKGQPTGKKSKDTSTDEMELEQGKHKKVCNHPTPEKMKEKGPNLIKNQGSGQEGTTADDNVSMTEESFDEMEEETIRRLNELEDRILDQKTKLMACKKAGKDQETQLNALDALIATMDPTDQATKDLKKWATHAIILSQIKGLEDAHDGASNGSTVAAASRGSSVASMPTNSTSTASGPPAKRPRRNSTTSTMGNQGVAATGNQVAEEEEEDSKPAARPTNVPNEIVWNDDNEADV